MASFKDIANLSFRKMLLNVGVVFVILSLVSGGINYLYYPFMARILTLQDFGASQALITILTQAGSVFAGLSLLTIYLVKKVKSNEIPQIISIIQKVIVSILILITIALIAIHPIIASFLNIDNNLNLIVVAIDLIVSIPFVISFGYLLSQKRFIPAAMLQLTVVSVKLLTGVFMASWFGIFGALSGIGLGYIFGMMIFWVICKFFSVDTWPHSVLASYRLPSKNDIIKLKPYMATIVAILVVSTCLVIYPSFDVVIARHYLDADLSGLYAAASTLSSVVLFASLPIINILTPHLDLSSLSKSSKYIKQTIKYILMISVFSIIVLYIFPTLLLSLFGQEYTANSQILWIFGINMLFVCLLNIYLQVIVLYKPITGLVLSIFGIITVYIFTSIFNSSAYNIIASVVGAYAIILSVCIVSLYLLINKTKKLT